jgi:alpha-glucosidase
MKFFNQALGSRAVIIGLALGLLTGCVAHDPQAHSNPARLTLRSPDGKIEVVVTLEKALRYAVSVDGQVLLRASKLGLQFSDGTTLGEDVELLSRQSSASDSTWENRWGKRRQVHDRHNELRLVLREKSAGGKKFEVAFRAFDDGIAFRYALPSQAGLKSFVLERERTEFAFADNYACFAGQQEKKSFPGSHEWEFEPGRLADIGPKSVIGLPLLIQTPNAWVGLMEADLRDWAGMWLGGATGENANRAQGVTLATRLSPRHDGQGVVQATAPHNSPWRVLLIARQPGQLIESDLVLNLSTPCQLADTSWVRPGKAAWDWWSGLSRMNTFDLEQDAQLAADMGWAYQLIDEGWYGRANNPGADITKVTSALDWGEVRRFAKENGVGIWLWLHWTDVDRNDAYQKAFALYEQWGIAGVKIDFMERDDQEMVNWYEKITKTAAQHHLMVDFHGAFKPAGFNRTFPNQITREGILGNEYNRWSARVTPEHKLTLPFTRFLEGPGDFTPGGFVNRQPAQFIVTNRAPQVQGTRCSELALFVVYESPFCCACDHPSHYYNQPGADFLKIVPTVWDDTRVLDAEVARHLVVARRSGGDWFLGGLNDRQARDLTVKLDFLEKGAWKLRLWKDARDSDQDATHLEVEERMVKPGDSLTLRLASAGGFVGHLQRQ